MRAQLLAILLLITACGAADGQTVIISPNMGMPVPVVGQDPGPDWANNINASLGIIDSHNHTPGQGVPVPPAGLNINSDLTFQNNNATNLRTARFQTQSGTPSLGSDLGELYETGVDLYYIDGAGNNVRITQGGSVTGSAGTITGLPSGTASASYSAGMFTFQSATNTPATVATGPLVVGAQIASPKTVTIAPPSGLAANYNLTLPSAVPGSTSFLDMDTSGNLATVASTGSGNVVLATSPTLSGPTISGAALSGTLSGSPTFSGSPTLNNGGTLNGTFGGTQALSGTLTITGVNPTFTQSFTAQGGAGFFGPVVISSGGGNVPHNCGLQSTSTSSAVTSITCSGGGFATGGGCISSNSTWLNYENFPLSSGSSPTGWECGYSGGAGGLTVTAYAICCTL